MFYPDLKLIFIFLKIFGFVPIQNVFSASNRLKVRVISFHTFFCIATKAFIICLYVTLNRNKFTATHVTLIITTISYEILQLLNLYKFINLITLVERFDTMIGNFSNDVCIKKIKYSQFCFAIVVIVYNIAIRFLSKHVITWKTYLKNVLFIVIIFPSIMVPILYIIFSNQLTKRFELIKKLCVHVEERSSQKGVFSVYKLQNHPVLENVRLAYVLLCKATDSHFRLYDLPVALYFLGFLLEAFYYCYLVTVHNKDLHYYHLLRFVYNCYTIYEITNATDCLKYAMVDFIRVLRKFQANNFSNEIQNQVEIFIIQVQQSTVQADNSGYISISRQLIPSLATSFVTYFIVLAQLAPELKRYF